MFFKLKKSLRYGYFAYRTRKLYASDPIPCDPAAPCEVHTMLGAEDTPLYLVAIKSFLRFYRSVSVVVLSDGTLDGRGEALIRRHVPGCRIVTAAEADERARRSLGEDSFLSRWRRVDVSYRRLIDTELWSSTGRRIILDSDVLVLRRPGEVIEWIEEGGPPFLIGQPTPPRPPASPGAGPRHVQAIFVDELGRLAERLGKPAAFLDGGSAGFYGCGPEMPLGEVERVLRACLELGLPMQQWGGEQSLVVYLLSCAGARRLDPERCFNFWPDCLGKVEDAEVIHFIGSNRFYKNVYVENSSRVSSTLSRGPRPSAV